MTNRYATALVMTFAGITILSTPASAQLFTGGGTGGRPGGGGGGGASSDGGTYGGTVRNGSVDVAPRGGYVDDTEITQSRAQAEATDATAAYNAANAADALAAKTLANVLDQRQSDFDKSPELLADKQAVADASTDTDAAKKAVLTALKDKPAYAAAVAKATAAHRKVDSIRANNGLPSQVSDAAQTAMQNDTAVSKMEGDACDADPAYKAAHAKLIAATTALKDLKTNFARSFSTDPAVVAAKKDKSTADLALAKAKGIMDAKVNYVHSVHPATYYR